jgi:hypothetical protein
VLNKLDQLATIQKEQILPRLDELAAKQSEQAAIQRDQAARIECEGWVKGEG